MPEYSRGNPIDIVRQEIERFIASVDNALSNPQPWSISSLPREAGGYGSQGGPYSRYGETGYRDPSTLFGGRQGGRYRSLMGSGSESNYIPIDLSETEQAYILHAELPGLNERDIEVSITGSNMLVIQGHKQQSWESGQQGGQQQGQRGGQGTSGTTGSGMSGSQSERQARYHVTERSYGQFIRSIELPQNVDRDRISAEFSRGLLTVTLPKTAESQRQQRKIEVRAAQ